MSKGEVMSEEHKPLPVSGYTAQSEENVGMANLMKEIEERYLRMLDTLESVPEFDKRMIALARTHIQTGAMWAVRSIFQPKRIKLPEDAP